MGTTRTIAMVLVIVGALNWLLVGLFGFDLVAAITGNSFGEKNALSSIVYVLVGIAGRGVLLDIAALKGRACEPGESISAAELEAAAQRQHVAMEPGDILLVKASHGLALGDVVKELVA